MRSRCISIFKPFYIGIDDAAIGNEFLNSLGSVEQGKLKSAVKSFTEVVKTQGEATSEQELVEEGAGRRGPVDVEWPIAPEHREGAHEADGPHVVVGVEVGGEHTRDPQSVRLDEVDEFVDGVRRVDEHALAAGTVADGVGEVHHLLGDGVGVREVAAREQLAEVEAVVTHTLHARRWNPYDALSTSSRGVARWPPHNHCRG